MKFPTHCRPRIYCASPLTRAKMWRVGIIPDTIEVVSTWHKDDLYEPDIPPDASASHWALNFAEMRQADGLLVYAERNDRPNGTLVEIGYCLAHEMAVHIVGNFAWGSWRYDPLITHHATLRDAVAFIVGETIHDPTEN